MLYIEDDVIYLTRGDDGALELNRLVDAEGTLYEMQEGDTLTMTVREVPTQESPVIFQTTSAPGSNRVVIRSADTANADPGRYSTDIQLVTADGLRFTVWPTELAGNLRYRTRNLKNFIIMPEVTIP